MDGEIKFKNDRAFEILALCAFRYCVNRHLTGAMCRGWDDETPECVILQNLDHINTNFKCQMMEDIEREFDIYDMVEPEGTHGDTKVIKGQNGCDIYLYSPHYLESMLNALKEDYKKNHKGKEWTRGMQT